MMNEKSTLDTASTKDIITFLDDIQIALGLSQQQMNTVILLLAKAEVAHLYFRIGNMDIKFGSYHSEDSDDKEITVETCTSQKNYANTISYKIPQIYIHSVKKKSSFVKST
jgi:competence protein ComGF